MLPAPTITDLEAFTGRPAATFGGFAPQALEQATLMFTIVTGLTELPTEPDKVKLANYAIMELADRILLEQPFQAIKAGPFQSESIGSYSYSRVTATSSKVQAGLKTGLWWWDLALDELTVAGTSVIGHGSVGPNPDGLILDGGTGEYVIVNAAENDGGNQPPYVRIS